MRQKKGVGLSELLTGVLKRDIEIIEAMKLTFLTATVTASTTQIPCD